MFSALVGNRKGLKNCTSCTSSTPLHSLPFLILITTKYFSGVLCNNPTSTQPGHPSVGRHNEYWWWSRSPLGKKWRVLHNSGRVSGLLAYWPSRLKALVAMGPAIRMLA